MSKPRERWWTYARNCVRAYPELKRRYEQLHEMPVTRQPKEIVDPTTGKRADFYGAGGGGGAQRQIEQTVMRELSRRDQKELDAVRLALEAIALRPDGDSRIRFIEHYHFQGLKMQDGAYRAHISERTAKRWNRELIYLVARNLGLL